jgi:hypothetical protein
MFTRVLLSVGDDANDHNLLLKGRPFVMRLQQRAASSVKPPYTF